MADFGLCNLYLKMGCTLHRTCERTLAEPEPENQGYVIPDYYAGACWVYREIQTLADKRREENELARERHREATT
jgi:hypothetical protein